MIIDDSVYSFINSIGFEDFSTKLKEQDLRFEKAIKFVTESKEFLHNVSEIDSGYIKAGTVLFLKLVNVLRKGKTLSSLTKDDWAEIYSTVKDIAIDMDPSRYSHFVFTCWDKMLATTFNNLKERGATERISIEIEQSLSALHDLINSYDNDEVDEIHFIEDSLSFCMQTFTYLVTAYVGIATPDWAKDLVDSLGVFAVEISRYNVYAKEHELLLQWEASRNELNETLRLQFDNYYKVLRSNIDSVLELMSLALSDNPSESFKGSAELAEMLGIGTDRLTTISDIDEYFL